MSVRFGNAPSRRSFLLAAGTAAAGTTAALAGCSLPDVLGTDEPDPRAPAVVEALRAVAAESLDLAARHDGAIVLLPDLATRLTALRDAHREHAAAIGRSLNETPQPSAGAGSPGATPGGQSAALKALAAAERSAAERAATSCLQVTGHDAPLVGTIAAARASHAEALT